MVKNKGLFMSSKCTYLGPFNICSIKQENKPIQYSPFIGMYWNHIAIEHNSMQYFDFVIYINKYAHVLLNYHLSVLMQILQCLTSPIAETMLVYMTILWVQFPNLRMT